MATKLIVVVVVVAMAAAPVKARPNTGPGGSLVDQMHGLAQTIRDISEDKLARLTNNSVTTNTTDQPRGIEPISGRKPGTVIDVCETMCPKWCQKITSTEGSFTNCHYLCGDLCNKKNAGNNPFVGNSRYEVVPSDFQFSRYDINQDKLVSVEEFARVEKVSKHEAWDLFLFADFNKDGFIDSKEFKGGPLVFTVQMASELSSMALNELTAGMTTATPTTIP